MSSPFKAQLVAIALMTLGATLLVVYLVLHRELDKEHHAPAVIRNKNYIEQQPLARGVVVAVATEAPAAEEEATITIPVPVSTTASPESPRSRRHDLPGAQGGKHFILELSDDEYDSIPLSTMMEHYGEADGGGSCEMDFGNKLVRRWRATRARNCEPSSPAASVIDCFLVRQTRHHGNGDNLCLMSNVSVDLELFANRATTRRVVKEYVETTHMKQPYVPFPRGFVKGACQPTSAWRAESMPGWNVDWTVNAFEPVSENELAASCSRWVEHPVLVVQRDTFANFFHDSEDFTNAFLAMAILQWTRGEAQVYLTDLYPRGPFWEMWAGPFSSGKYSNRQAATAWDLQKEIAGGAVPRGRTCFRNLAVGIYGPAASITVASWDTPCKRTALVRAYSDYVIRGMGLQHRTHYASPAANRTIVVTWMARRASTEWPEKRFCDDANSYFECAFWAAFGIRSLGRMVRNERQVVDALKGLQGEKFRNGAKVIVRDVDYNILSLQEQIATDLETDIMIGPHGAGLMHNVFMRDRAALIELFVDGSSANRHFHNLAHWFGRPYRGEPMGNPIDAARLLDLVRSTVENIKLDDY